MRLGGDGGRFATEGQANGPSPGRWRQAPARGMEDRVPPIDVGIDNISIN